MPCVKKTTKRYTERKSPPYPANECKGKVKKGNDGKMYVSVPNVNGIYRWKRKSANKPKKQQSTKKPKESGKKPKKDYNKLEDRIKALAEYAEKNGFHPSDVKIYLELYNFI